MRHPRPTSARGPSAGPLPSRPAIPPGDRPAYSPNEGRHVPGFHSPAAGFDEPMAVLAGCHERMHRTLRLLGRLADAVAQGREDDAVRSAAVDVQRYFDQAGPAHHEDEERWIFPLLMLRCERAEVRDAVQLLTEQHIELGRRWEQLRKALAAVAAGGNTAFDAGAQTLAAGFIKLYQAHAALEDELVFPAAAALVTGEELQRMGADMARRRGVRHPSDTP